MSNIEKICNIIGHSWEIITVGARCKVCKGTVTCREAKDFAKCFMNIIENELVCYDVSNLSCVYGANGNKALCDYMKKYLNYKNKLWNEVEIKLNHR